MGDQEDLRGIIGQLRGEVAALHARVDSLEAASGKFVPDKELDGPKGSFRVPFDPKAWSRTGDGNSYKGKEIRDCPPDFLLVLAEFFDWSAANPKPRPGRERYAEADKAAEIRRAALCRSWERRKRAGWAAPAQEDVGEFPGDATSSAPAFDDFAPPPYAPPPSTGDDDGIPF